MLVYHKYTNANIGIWWVGTQLNIFSNSKQPNNGRVAKKSVLQTNMDLGNINYFSF